MKKKALILALINCIFFALISMQEQSQTQPTFIELIQIQAQSYAKPTAPEVISDTANTRKWVSAKSRYKQKKIVFDSINFKHRWGTYHVHLQECTAPHSTLFLPRFEWKKRMFAPNKKIHQEVNQIFNAATILSSLKTDKSSNTLKNSSATSEPHSITLNLEPLQNFFFKLMPWYYRNPHYYALSFLVPCCLATWYVTRYSYQTQ